MFLVSEVPLYAIRQGGRECWDKVDARMTPPTLVGFNPQYMNDGTYLSFALLLRPARGCVHTG